MTKIFYQDEIGADSRQGNINLSACDQLAPELRTALHGFLGGDLLVTPTQEEALQSGITETNGKDFLITAPTNSGKTLIAVFRIFTRIMRGDRRCVFVAPLKALAEEKAFEFRAIADLLAAQIGKKIRISVTTGDYQTSRDFLGSPPPKQGEIIICTPERLEVMLRNPSNHEWARAVDTFVFDEFHLIGDHTRGATVETLISRIFYLGGWSSLILLSATLGSPEKITKWFGDAGRNLVHIDSSYRFPKLQRNVVLTEKNETALEAVITEIVDDSNRSALVFVGSRKDADFLSDYWRQTYPEHCFASFHAGLGSNTRNELQIKIRSGQIKAVAATTSLKMGVNFPVTDVIIRDAFLRGKRGTFPLNPSDISQMTGRAGRGNVPGKAFILASQEDEAAKWADILSSGVIEDLKPRLVANHELRRTRSGRDAFQIDSLRGVILSHFVQQPDSLVEDIAGFLKLSLSAQFGGISRSRIQEGVEFLLKNHLIEVVEGKEGACKARPLGKTICYSGISPESGSLMASLLRALISIQNKAKDQGKPVENLVARLRSLDFLFLAVSALECRDYWIKKSDDKILADVPDYIEKLPLEEKPLFNRWRNETDTQHPTRRLLATLKVDFDQEKTGDASETFQRIMGTAILLHRHAKGECFASLSGRYGGKRQLQEGDFENGLKHTVVWILSCLSQICDPEKAYDMGHVKMKVLDLIEDVALGSEMGKLTNKPGIGPRTIRKLIDAGIASLETLQTASPEKLKSSGLSSRQIASIQSKAIRRRR